MILIWSVVVILVILGGWWWLKELEWKTTAENAKLRERLEQPTHGDGYSWTNEATADVFQGIWLHWEACWEDAGEEWPEAIQWLWDGENFNLSAEHLRTAYGLKEYIPMDNKEHLYYELIDYDQLSERLQESFKKHYPDKEYRIE